LRFRHDCVRHACGFRRHDGRVKLVLAFFVTLALAGAARAADIRVVTVSPAEDLSLPFWCDWGYDWDERCFTDRSDRLGVGGVDDKVWRAALRFSLDALPPGATVVVAELSLAYDGTCVAPARRLRPCEGGGFDLVGRPIFSPQWLHEREVEYGPVVAYAELEPFAPPGRLVVDITDLVGDWHTGDPAYRRRPAAAQDRRGRGAIWVANQASNSVSRIALPAQAPS
jgi:hypothetical protein